MESFTRLVIHSGILQAFEPQKRSIGIFWVLNLNVAAVNKLIILASILSFAAKHMGNEIPEVHRRKSQ